ncbi:MAG TPA: 3-hydroxyacyl-CoA dehydrogenase NAD-binding domain-containing protein [Acidobacteriota bacterium]
MSDDPTQYSRKGAVGVIAIDSPPVNGLGHAVREGIHARLQEALSDPEVLAIVIHGGGRMFSAGADIKEFGSELAFTPPTLSEVIDAIEGAGKPVVAAIHGVAAGGGCELALGCHYRIAGIDARLGLPEVTLGIIPGAGGTQRLPRLVGVPAALDLIVQGKLNPAPKAHEIGLVDELFEGEPAAAGVLYAKKLITAGGGPRRTRDQNERVEAARGKDEIFAQYRKETARRARGLEAPLAAIDSIENATNLPFEEGMKAERVIFDRLLASEQSQAMRHAFFAEREVAKIPDIPRDTPTREVKKAGVIGCGTMGQGIAMAFANAGIPVRVLEVDQEALDAGLEKIEQTYDSSLAKGRISQEDRDLLVSTIAGTLDYADMADADLVVEAVFEDMGLKKKVFARLDEVCRAGAILATNTSTLDVDEIAAATGRPGDVLGLHFFSPAHVMRLLEIVRGDQTAKDVVATALALAQQLKKTGVVVGVCEGFVGNRMLLAYLREAYFVLEEGALPQEVDKAICDFGFPMGPFTMLDMAGLGVGYLIRKHQAARRPAGERYSDIEDRIVEMDRLGQKTGAGWYRYQKGDRTPIPDPEIEAMIVETSEKLGIQRRTFSDAEIIERCLYPLVNEGAKLLDEGIAIRAGDIDVVWLHGYGFPRHKGGPMFWADTMGVRTIYDKLVELQAEHGDLLAPAELLEELAEQGKGFADL